MKARTLILTAGMAVALVTLTAQPAAAMFPTDGGKSAGLLVSGKQRLVSSTSHAKASATSIKASAYSKFAYVPGGSSARVAKAITAAGKKLAKQSHSQPSQPSKGSGGTQGGPSSSSWTPATTVTPGTFDPGVNACLSYSVCTPEEDCAIWGYNCSLLELSPVTPVVSEAVSGDEWVYIDPIEQDPTFVTQSAGPVDGSSSTLVSSDEDLYQDC